jgi:hypothetical protein
MMPGHWVIVDGEPWQLVRWPISTHVLASGNWPVPATEYHLIRVPHGHQAQQRKVVVHEVTATGKPIPDNPPVMVPACRSCGTRAGLPCPHLEARCIAWTYRDQANGLAVVES